MSEIHEDLLAWYDQNARAFPWRIPPRQGRQDTYRAWLAEVMLQQTTTTTVIPYYERFLATWPTVEDLANAEDADVMAAWAGLGYYARARNMLSAARRVRDLGAWPQDRAGLSDLPGLGPYTSAAVAAISFDERVPVVDGNVKRVFSRVLGIRKPLPTAQMESAVLSATPQDRPGDFAQAVMDLGATVCRPKNPKCDACPLAESCLAHFTGYPEDFPEKVAKPSKPVRFGKIWVITNEAGDQIMARPRPAKGLLGGTLGLPGSGWDGSEEPDMSRFDCREVGEMTHVFTHFTAKIVVFRGTVPHGDNRAQLTPLSANADNFPTLMRKAILTALRT